MTKEENDLLTQTDRGTPCGEMIRRYWQPAALSKELPVGGAPLPVRILGEDLVLFRDDKGNPGLLGIHCSHRGADLSYGRVEDGGIRCIYHGWLYDIRGNCLDMPGEPEGGRPEQRASIQHPAYPCRERNGVIFAYLGPGDAPLLPNYEFLTVPENHASVTKMFHDCNYLQGSEGNNDPIHNTLLHYPFQVRGVEITGVAAYQGFRGGRGAAPGMDTVDAEITNFGVRLSRTCPAGPDKKYFRIFCYMLPNLTAFPGGPQGPEGYSVNWHVPIDDTHHWKYIFSFSRERPVARDLANFGRGAGLTADYKPTQNKANRYMQDREIMKTRSYSGIDGVPMQDLCAVEGEGPIQDRTKEHLATSDRAIVAQRKLLQKAIKDVQEGKDPPHVIRDPAQNRFPNIIIYVGVLPTSVEWKDHCKLLEAEVRA